jgi:hypothetical protein
MTEKSPSNNSGAADRQAQTGSLHPAWLSFIRYCAQLRHGEIERLCIQDGVPVLAESTTKKIKFT